MKPEKITARELCRMVLQKVNEPITASEVCEIAEKNGYHLRLDSEAEDWRPAIPSLLGREATTTTARGEFKRENTFPYLYSLRYPPIIDEDDEQRIKIQGREFDQLT